MGTQSTAKYTHTHACILACLSHLIVAIAYGKGVVLKEVYEKMDGQFFAQFIRTHFNIAFARSGPKRYGRRLFIMDNDPSQRTEGS